MITAGITLARWSASQPSATNSGESHSAQVAPSSLNPASPSKEYIYAGGRLIATEEPSSAPGCSFSISPSSQSFASSGGTGSVSVTAGTGCAWTSVSNAAFITITSGSSGSGNGAVNYSVAQNTSASSRTGTLTVAGQTFTVTQAGTGGGGGCTYSINPSSQNFTASSGTGSIGVAAGTGCTWTASSNASWITITSGASGTGNGTVNYSVASNGTTSQRTGTMTIAGQTFTVTQAGSSGGGTPCQFVSISPGTRTVNSSAGNYSFTIGSELPAGCSWLLTSNASWLTITSATSGSGPATVTYSVTQNTSGVVRQGNITNTTTNQKHTVKQNP